MSSAPVALTNLTTPFRKGMRALLAARPDFEVIGEAATGSEAITLAEALQPDLVLMDLQMPGGSGIPTTREIVAASPHIRVLVVTLFEDDDSVFTALRAGARGYVLKDAEEDKVVRAIRAVGSGEAIFSPSSRDAGAGVLCRLGSVRTTPSLSGAD